MAFHHRSIPTPLVVCNGEAQFAIRFDEITSIPDALGTYGETLIGKGRSGRSIPATSRDPAPPCSLCGERSKFPGASVFSTDNKHPFGPLVHKVIVLGEPKHEMSKINHDDLVLLYEEAYGVAKEARQKMGVELDGVSYGMNCGEYKLSGASQSHIHSQLTGLSPGSVNAADRLGALCAQWQEEKHRESYLEDYLAALRRPVTVDGHGFPVDEMSAVAGSANEPSHLIIEENPDAALVVPISQRFRGALQIVVKIRGVGNLLETSEAIRRSVAELEYSAIEAFRRLGYVAFNSVTYATRFSAANDYDQRLIVNLYPRSSVVALSELLDRYVCDESPWKCAKAIRGEAVT
jgi:diadenosine tetraphosphate (Ap4A) HIT family hydrolase